MIVFASFCPHPPLLVPSVGKENLSKLKKTAAAYKKLEKDFYTANPDTIVIVTPHGTVYEDAISVNLCDKYFGDFEEFGDFSTKVEFKADHQLIDRLQRHMRRADVNVTLDTCEKLDHGSLIPLYLFTENLKSIKVVPISRSDQDPKAHFNFGQELKEFLLDSNKRVALIASGDLSHSLTTDSPAGYSESGQEFDDMVQELLASKNSSALISLDPKMIEEANQCALRPLAVLIGALQGMEYETELLAYESPFGVGYLTCNFKLK